MSELQGKARRVVLVGQKPIGEALERALLAVSMAVDASKALVSIAIAFFVAMGGFIQFAISHDLKWNSTPVIFLAVAALLALISMIFGFNAIGNAFRRGEGRIDAEGPAWTTTPLKAYLTRQSYAGLGAMAAFGLALFLWDSPQSTGGVSIHPTSAVSAPASNRKIRLEGEWSRLTVQRGAMSITLEPASVGTAKAFDIELH